MEGKKPALGYQSTRLSDEESSRAARRHVVKIMLVTTALGVAIVILVVFLFALSLRGVSGY
jgi:hypothetical protein